MLFFHSFIVFFMFTVFGIPDIERRLITDRFKWCIAAVANVAFVVSVIVVDIVLYPAVVLHRVPVPAFG